jgi:hypothetical protein
MGPVAWIMTIIHASGTKPLGDSMIGRPPHPLEASRDVSQVSPQREQRLIARPARPRHMPAIGAHYRVTWSVTPQQGVSPDWEVVHLLPCRLLVPATK